MNDPIDRFLLLLKVEDVRLPWLEERTGVERKRWANVKSGRARLLATEIQVLSDIWPEYAYWLATGLELPEVGQISPMTKQAHHLSGTHNTT